MSALVHVVVLVIAIGFVVYVLGLALMQLGLIAALPVGGILLVRKSRRVIKATKHQFDPNGYRFYRVGAVQ